MSPVTLFTFGLLLAAVGFGLGLGLLGLFGEKPAWVPSLPFSLGWGIVIALVALLVGVAGVCMMLGAIWQALS